MVFGAGHFVRLHRECSNSNEFYFIPIEKMESINLFASLPHPLISSPFLDDSSDHIEVGNHHIDAKVHLSPEMAKVFGPRNHTRNSEVAFGIVADEVRVPEQLPHDLI